MKSDLPMIFSLKGVMESAAEGRGISQSVVRGLGRDPLVGREAARQVLLGFPLAVSLSPLLESKSEEVSMLGSLIVSAPRSSASLVGRSGGSLALILERWIKAREGAELEQKVLRFRSLVTSGVLGAVMAMMASLGPLVGSLGFAGPAAGSGQLLYGAGGMAAVSSTLLGVFMSGRGFIANVLVSLGVFVLVAAAAAPLVSLPVATLWGVK